MIPRILHLSAAQTEQSLQSWYSMVGEKIGERVTKDVGGNDEYFLEERIGWEIKIWDDNMNQSLIETKYPEYYQYYLKLTPTERLLVMRYFYLHALGGFFADHDVECLKPIDSLRMIPNCSVILGEKPSIFSPQIQTKFMGSVPNHSLWQTFLNMLLTTTNDLAPSVLAKAVDQFADVHIFPMMFFASPTKSNPETFVWSHPSSETTISDSFKELQQSTAGNYCLLIIAICVIGIIILTFLRFFGHVLQRLSKRLNIRQNSPSK